MVSMKPQLQFQNRMNSILDKVLQTLKQEEQHNSSIMVKPEVILWPDPDRQWTAVIPILQATLPQMLVYGPYDHAIKLGPSFWNIRDDRHDGFSALLNYHIFTKENLSKLIYTYLGDWIRMCDATRKSGESVADNLYSAAIKLKEKLKLILQGEAPYDIFVRWKPIGSIK